jgi:hypothetical protein
MKPGTGATCRGRRRRRSRSGSALYETIYMPTVKQNGAGAMLRVTCLVRCFESCMRNAPMPSSSVATCDAFECCMLVRCRVPVGGLLPWTAPCVMSMRKMSDMRQLVTGCADVRPAAAAGWLRKRPTCGTFLPDCQTSSSCSCCPSHMSDMRRVPRHRPLAQCRERRMAAGSYAQE